MSKSSLTNIFQWSWLHSKKNHYIILKVQDETIANIWWNLLSFIVNLQTWMAGFELTTNTTLNRGNWNCWKLQKSLTTYFPSLSLSDKLPINLFTCCQRGPLWAQMEDGNLNNSAEVSLPHTFIYLQVKQSSMHATLWFWLLPLWTTSSLFKTETVGRQFKCLNYD